MEFLLPPLSDAVGGIIIGHAGHSFNPTIGRLDRFILATHHYHALLSHPLINVAYFQRAIASALIPLDNPHRTTRRPFQHNFRK